MIYLYYDKSKNTTASLPFLASLHSAAHNSRRGGLVRAAWNCLRVNKSCAKRSTGERNVSPSP